MFQCSDMTVLEIQRARRKCEQEYQEEGFFCGTHFNSPHREDLIMMMGDDHSLNPDLGFQNGWPELGRFNMGFGSGFDVNSMASPTQIKETFKKRKPQKPHNSKGVAESVNKEKKIKVSGDEDESKMAEQTSKKNTKANTSKANKETCGESSKENSKDSEVQNPKPDYIHVRARRGQATDSHSLAERVRREKISGRMKYLQDLVPGCNKITGKAGMLDEIINYVQSLQRQVEFLSMKLAAVNPRLDLTIDDLFVKEVFPACSPRFPSTGMQSDITTNPAYLQFSPAQLVSYFGGLINMGINPSDVALRRTIRAPVSLPETFIDSSSCFTQVLPSSTWEGDFQNLYNNVNLDQARTASFPSQTFRGVVDTSNLKMHM
ncbi:unnamed protein product [Lupinus luteus]|uniref:BHLH domain-containing protein n=1 Tax=Lupinus luteus TaxID=3873 RepID=A0AAV1W4X1_LUPLU